MTDSISTPAPDKSAGEHVVRLDADRTRDALADTLDQIESRFTPGELVKSAKITFSRSPGRVVSIAVGAVAAVGGLIALSVSRNSRG